MIIKKLTTINSFKHHSQSCLRSPANDAGLTVEKDER
ncbi:hypothetical protein BN439_0006 [Erwinia amylovora Ea644]|nr:hypothetical protein BN439_0006 [Erwinia amylovora Ea644]